MGRISPLGYRREPLTHPIPLYAMVKLLIQLPALRVTITIPIQHLIYYCGPRYHIGWLAGLGYTALHVEGDICRSDDKTPLDKSLAVQEDDVLNFVHNPSAAIRLINLCNVQAEPEDSSSSSASSENSSLSVDDVSERDPACVFTGWHTYVRPVYMLPVSVHTRGRFHEAADILGLQRIGELANLLRVLKTAAGELNEGNAFILASDERFVPLAYLQGLDASKEALEHALSLKDTTELTHSDIPISGTAENHFQLFYQHAAEVSDDMVDVLRCTGFSHQLVARFTPTAFDRPRSAPAREVYHHMYWGRMLLKYCDGETRERLQHVEPIIPKPPSVVGMPVDSSNNPNKAAGAPKRRSKRHRPTSGDVVRGADVVDFLIGLQKIAALPVEGPTGPDMPSGNDAVLEWRQSVQPADDYVKRG